ncbi:hypothetical protein GCM10022220_18080 [Actinocatenispora rupis]|uniref:Uncharacterized protein n=1 Tax=Actinocatenispora rupis TaxID=519421 RepID=A0A8J3NCZ7_9ACTN|nr:hypothetical protein Aru02nite_18680 [Actinocatenispora rupis]
MPEPVAVPGVPPDGAFDPVGHLDVCHAVRPSGQHAWSLRHRVCEWLALSTALAARGNRRSGAGPVRRGTRRPVRRYGRRRPAAPGRAMLITLSGRYGPTEECCGREYAYQKESLMINSRKR